MKNKIIHRSLLVVILLLAFGLIDKPSGPVNGDNVFSLRPPPFTGVARAEPATISSFLDDEAGMSAYFDASTTIDLDDVRDVFRTIEVETSHYIIGSIPVSDYPETEDVHVYVHKGGWILAYYLAGDPVGKIFDWRVYHDTGRTNITTKLENTLAVVAGEAGVSFPGATYYHFRYPNATHLMLIVEWVRPEGNDSFQIKLPGSFAYYERSWSLANNYDSNSWCKAWYKVNGVQIRYHSGSRSSWWISQGTLTPVQLPPDQYHWIEVYSDGQPSVCYTYGGLSLVYRVP
ncbi:unnamed protein product [marine sediment metagenome]|uniref:Uncharacterized protein n=1 Tax=marine sediment metagenome TaxID=412755 RepID=X0S8E5_9ZZZZ